MSSKFIKRSIIFLLLIITITFSFMICKYNQDSIKKWWKKEIYTSRKILFNIRYFTNPEDLEAKNGGVAQRESTWFATRKSGVRISSSPPIFIEKVMNREI